MSVTIKPSIWGHIIAGLIATQRLDAELFRETFESLANATLPVSDKPDVQGLVALVQEKGHYTHLPFLLSVISGIDQAALERAAEITQSHFDSPDYLSDDDMRDMTFQVNLELDKISREAMRARAAATVLDSLVSAGRFPASQIQPLLGFSIDPALFPVYQDQMDEPNGTYLAMHFAVTGEGWQTRFDEALFHVSYMTDLPVEKLALAVERLRCQLEQRKAVTHLMALSLLGLSAA